jgi:hypothetical protein
VRGTRREMDLVRPCEAQAAGSGATMRGAARGAGRMRREVDPMRLCEA